MTAYFFHHFVTLILRRGEETKPNLQKNKQPINNPTQQQHTQIDGKKKTTTNPTPSSFI